MKLNYHHSGLQFFFITITLIGRRKLLSRLIDEKHRPELLPLGELAKAALVAFHGAFPPLAREHITTEGRRPQGFFRDSPADPRCTSL